MRSGGFPCRYGGCDACFTVTEQGSMPALLAASAARSAHEVEHHGYHHIRLDEVVRKPAWTMRRPAVKP